MGVAVRTLVGMRLYLQAGSSPARREAKCARARWLTPACRFAPPEEQHPALVPQSPRPLRYRPMNDAPRLAHERMALRSAGLRRPLAPRTALASLGHAVSLAHPGSLYVALALFAGGCTPHFGPPPIVTKAKLGSVIVYRNGVAYFERHATPDERELKLRVPGERVDDFLKSLTIADDATGEALPISYPTMQRDGGNVDMVIALPERSSGLKVTYVTESPSWKPSYRLALGAPGEANLQAWAVVDNVSGEDWKDVKIGVGSTSALSFRFDLHSVRLVERQTLVSDDMLALAPPTGGSPHAAEPRDLREAAALAAAAVAALGDDDGTVALADGTDEERANKELEGKDDEPFGAPPPPVQAMPTMPFRNAPTKGLGTAQGFGRGSRGSVAGGLPSPDRPDMWAQGNVSRASKKGRPSHHAEADKNVRGSAGSRARELALKTAQMLTKSQRLRVEGYAQKGDADPRNAALERANRVRNGLIANGVPADRIDAVGVPEEGTEAVRMVVAETATGESAVKDAGGRASETVSAEPLGQAHFVSSEAMTIGSGHSAMVSTLQSPARADRVYYYDPISKRGSKDFAFNAIRLENPSPYTLDGGPFTIYEEGQFLGEGLSDALLPGTVGFIPYALDRAIVVTTEGSSRDEIERLLTLERGIAKAAARRVHTTKRTLSNRGTEAATVYLRHEPLAGHTLIHDGPVEKLGGAYLFRVTVPAGTTLPFVIEEKTPVERILDLRGDAGVAEIAVFLKREKVDDALAVGLGRIVTQHEEGQNLARRTEVVDEQLRVFRQRTDEINAQLFLLKKLPQGEKLRRHLATRMDEISARIQSASLERAELEGKKLSARIELQEAVAELAFDEAKKAPDPAPRPVDPSSAPGTGPGTGPGKPATRANEKGAAR